MERRPFAVQCIAPLGAFLLASCGSVDEPARQDPIDPVELTVRIVEPASSVITNGTVPFEVELSGDAPDEVSLTVDGSPIATLAAPYRYDWDTSSAAEGDHAVVAVAKAAGETFESDAVTVTVDRTAPTVVSRTPAPGTRDYWLRTPITAEISEPLAQGSVTDSSVMVEADGFDIAKTVELSPDGTTITATLAGAPAVPTSLTITFSASLTDLAGNAMEPPADAWTLDAPEWIPLGEPLSATGASAERASLALSEGEPIVSWLEEAAPDSWDVRVARWDGADWEPLGGALGTSDDRDIVVGSFTDASYDSVSLALEADGAPVVAWTRNTEGVYDVVVSRWDGAAWQSVGEPLSAAGGACIAPSLVLDDDAPVVAWTQWLATYDARVFVRRWDGASWVDLGGEITETSHYSEGADVDVADGLPVVGFWDWDTDHPSRGYVWSWDGAAWSPLGDALNVDTGYVFGLDVALDEGDPLVAWLESNGTSYFVRVSRWDGAWTPLGARLDATVGTTYANHVSLAIDAGEPVIAWDESDGMSSKAVYVRRWRGEEWQSLGTFSAIDGANTDATIPSLAVDATGAMALAWSEDDGTGISRIHVQRYNQ